ncbi:PEPxxWA-CTERM sorting domain-containing protein [Phenylobacterium sp.]|uniref:Npun_F0296 family exosortase-dependent surface protein n=1 Tax=Phenylobacterium sp. TaxID=1871053 RepID=UPI0025DB6E2E|nr:PEPxxWA-CTERM sorting domain-containing protein [Phenylobacterium sp.]MBX3483104.1 PEPxxWA-CTERM sorting domain-containing protein [Phenylobacterium sp.]MCW5760310.1 PEPxxWA-CTERM sorting domain-containing protein [Phenylobacterium sp.]
MNKHLAALAATGALAMVAGPANANLSSDFTVRVEAPGVVNTTATFDYVGVETFDARALGFADFPSDFGGGDGSNVIVGDYSGVNVIRADQYGGAGGPGYEGQYAVVGLNSPDRSYTITFTQTGGSGINYFGYWLSALDAGNTVEFFNGANSLGAFTPENLISIVSGNSAYYGNPYNPTANSGEPYAFVNFYLNEGTFDRIVFRQAPGTAGYESDNHTVGWFTSQGDGTVIPPVPEPGAWALMIMGFGATGAMLRRRRAFAAA